MTREPNQLPGRCIRCGRHVPAGEGSYRSIKSATVTWAHVRSSLPGTKIGLLEHHDCRERYAGSSVHHILNPDEDA